MADRPTRLLAAAVVVAAVGVLASVERAVSDDGTTPAASERDLAATTASSRSPGSTSSTAVPSSTTASGVAVDGGTRPPDPTGSADDEPGPLPTDAGAEGDGTAIAPPELQAPAVGAYRERYDGPGGDGEGSLAVTRRGSSTTLRRRVEDSISSQTVCYDAEGVHLLVTSDGGGPCRFAVGPLLQPAVLDVGQRWSSDATCTTADGVSVQRVEEAEVTGRARTTVDGVAHDTWIIQRHIVETASAEDVVVVSETASSELFAPGVGLAVYRLARTDTPDPQGRVVSTAVAVELLSATPG